MDTKETTNMNTNLKKEVSESKTNESVTSPKEEQSTEHHQPSLKTDSFDPKPEEIINLYPKKPSLNKSGRSIQLVSNYFPFSFPNKETQKSFFKYAVLFNPDIPGDSVNLRKKLIRQIDSKIIEVYGQYFFNNTVLYSIENRETENTFTAIFDSITYIITVKWANFVEAFSSEALPIYKKFFFSLLGKMNFVQFKRNYFDKQLLKKVRDIEIWPGFGPSINLYEGRILLNLNTLSKIIRTENALDYLKHLNSRYNSSQGEFQNKANEDFKNISVLTKYNNDKTFVIDSVDFTKSPKSTFTTKNGSISYIEYYKTRYNKIIQDVNQPLLVSIDKKTKKTIHLIPEFCYLTGLTDEMRGDFNFMKEVTQYTIGQAHNKMVECIGLVKNMLNNVDCTTIRKKWGMSIEDKPVPLVARKLDPGKMMMKGQNEIPIDGTPDIDRKVQAEMHSSPNIKRWMMFYSKSVKDIVMGSFIPQLQKAIATFRMQIDRPLMKEIPSTKIWDWQKELEAIPEQAQFILVIMPGSRGKGFFYNEVKTFLTHKKGIPSQVILEGTIKKDRGLRSVINKVLIQICAKLDGEPWIINDLPYTSEPAMIISFCIYKDIITSCGTYNITFSKYFSKTVTLPEPSMQRNKIVELFKYQITQFKNMNGVFPKNIIVLRDGVAPSLAKIPIEEIKEMKRIISESCSTSKLSFILMNKKHNLKVVEQVGPDRYANIPSGTLIDNSVVGNEFEFYLVSQKAGQGISQATQYKIIYDEIELRPEDIHLLIYKMCFLYYNWTGGIKTPAPSHYAKKLAFLVGDKMSNKGEVSLPNDNIKSLFFL